MMSGDSCSDSNTLILHSQVIPPSSNNQEDTQEISTTNITSITSQDIVVKELLSEDNKEPLESESSPKRVKTGWFICEVRINITLERLKVQNCFEILKDYLFLVYFLV